MINVTGTQGDRRILLAVAKSMDEAMSTADRLAGAYDEILFETEAGTVLTLEQAVATMRLSGDKLH